MTNLETTKSTLARLLATENLNIEIRKAETAAFNPNTRTLILPLWKDISPELYDLLVGHEVGHALDTPAEGWHDAIVENMKPGFKSFLNVVEDARIERKIKTRYPGLRKSFVIGYRELCDKNFFGLDGKNVNDSLLIDRINIHFKLGVSANVQFKPEEQYFLDKIEATETFDDVYQVAKELYEYCKKEMQDLQQQPQPDETGEDSGDSSGDGESSGISEQSDKKQETDGDATDSGNVGEEGEDSSNDDDSSLGKDSSKSGDAGNFDPVSETDGAFQEAMKSLTKTTGELVTGYLQHSNNFNYDSIVVHWKNCVGKLVETEYEDYFSPGLLKEFEAKNKNALMYLVKEFEMRKRASELRRVSVAQTGQLDTNKLHTYKFNDDIFRRVASVAQGKNHGLYIVIDWSGSMGDNLKGTIEQLITLTQFCKKINVPFEVMAFSTEYKVKNEFGSMTPPLKQGVDIKNHLQVHPFNLLNLLSSTMPDKVYRQMCNDLLNAGAMRGRYLMSNFRLGGTPLNETLMVLPKLINDFKARNRLQIVNVAILTDGEDSDHIVVHGSNSFYSGISSSTNNRTSIIIDNETKKSYKIESRRGGVTIALLKILKDKTDCNLLGFYITQPWRSAYADVMQKFTNDIKYNKYKSPESARECFVKWKETKVDVVTNWGFDEYYIIPGGNELNVDDDDLDDIIGGGTNVTVRKLRGAFLKMNQNRLTNRVLLRRFIEKVS